MRRQGAEHERAPHDEWAEAKRRCRLSDEAVRMAKELGMGPRGLLKNIPAKSEPRKLPVEAWIRDRHHQRFGGAQPPRRMEPPPESAFAPQASDAAKSAAPKRNLLQEAEQALLDRIENEEVDPEALAEDRAALELDAPVSDGEIDEANRLNLLRWQSFRDASVVVAAALSSFPAVQKVLLLGSVAAPLRKEVPRHRRLRRAGAELWHECGDVDLAVWVDDLTQLRVLKRAVAQALNDWQHTHPDWPGVAHHQVDIFLIEPATNRFRGNLCHYGQCPKGKPECAVPGCGAQPFLQLYEGFRLYADALDGDHSVLLFDRAVASSPVAPDERISF